jgi:hypothetical protein
MRNTNKNHTVESPQIIPEMSERAPVQIPAKSILEIILCISKLSI